MARTRVPSEQLLFRSAATGEHILDTYLEACEKGGFTIPVLMDNLFTSEGGLNAEAVKFRVKADANGDPIFQSRFGHYDEQENPDPDAGWFDTNQKFFRQRGDFLASQDYDLLDLVRDGQVVYICTEPHTSLTTIDLTKFTKFFDGQTILTEIQDFKSNSEPRIDLLEESVLLGINVL